MLRTMRWVWTIVAAVGLLGCEADRQPAAAPTVEEGLALRRFCTELMARRCTAYGRCGCRVNPACEDPDTVCTRSDLVAGFLAGDWPYDGRAAARYLEVERAALTDCEAWSFDLSYAGALNGRTASRPPELDLDESCIRDDQCASGRCARTHAPTRRLHLRAAKGFEALGNAELVDALGWPHQVQLRYLSAGLWDLVLDRLLVAKGTLSPGATTEVVLPLAGRSQLVLISVTVVAGPNSELTADGFTSTPHCQPRLEAGEACLRGEDCKGDCIASVCIPATGTWNDYCDEERACSDGVCVDARCAATVCAMDPGQL